MKITNKAKHAYNVNAEGPTHHSQIHYGTSKEEAERVATQYLQLNPTHIVSITVEVSQEFRFGPIQ